MRHTLPPVCRATPSRPRAGYVSGARTRGHFRRHIQVAAVVMADAQDAGGHHRRQQFTERNPAPQRAVGAGHRHAMARRSILPLNSQTVPALGVAYDSHGSDEAAPLIIAAAGDWSVDMPSSARYRSSCAVVHSRTARSPRTASFARVRKPARPRSRASIVTRHGIFRTAATTVDDVSYHISTLVSASRATIATIVSIVLGIPGLRSSGPPVVLYISVRLVSVRQ